MQITYLPILLVLALLSGCQSLSYEDPHDDPKSMPPVDSVVVLNQTLEFRVGSSRSYIQHGVAMGENKVNIRQPYCLFYLYEPASALLQPRSIEADRFTVTRSNQGASFASIKPIRQAVYVPFGDVADGGGPSAQTLTTTLRLRSETQPQVHELQCSVFGERYYYGFVSVNQIIETLGDIVSLQFPDASQ